MRSKPSFVLTSLSLLAVALLAPVGGAQGANPVADSEAIRALEKQVREIGDPRLPQGGSQRIGENAPMFKAGLERQEALRRFFAQHEAELARMREAYASGARDHEVAAKMNAHFDSLAIDGDIGDRYAEVIGYREKLAQAPEMNARLCVQILRDNGTDADRLRGLHELYRTKAIVEARALLDLCPRFAPDLQVITQLMDVLRPRVESTLEEFREAEMAALRERTWEAGRGPKSLEAAGAKFLSSHPEWGGNAEKKTKILAVSIVGEWFAAEKNLLGQVTKWALPIHVAITTKDHADGIAQVFELSLITTGAAKKPPFEGYWVGETWLFLEGRLPKKRR